MTTLRKAAQQALEALEWFNKYGSEEHGPSLRGAECSLRAALAEPVQEPVAWLDEEINCAYTPEELDGGTADGLVPLYTAPPQRPAEPVQTPVAWMVYTLDGKSVCVTDNPADFTDQHKALPLYTTPPQRKPLNEDQMNEAYIYIWRNLPDGFDHTASAWIETAIRYAERAHGIIATEVNGDKDGPQG